VHGLFSTRRFDYVREIAVRAYYEWGFNVAAVDLRSFGLTGLVNEAPSSGGWKEGEDLLAVALQLKAMGATSVGALGISLGGSSVLAASHQQGAETALSGGILAISPPADIGTATERLSRTLPLKHPQYALNYGFRAMLLSRVRGSRWPENVSRLDEALDQVTAAYYELPPEEIRFRSSAVNHIGGARVPVLVLHPVDDRIIPVRHARMLAEAAAENDLVRVWELPGGGHGAIDAVDRHWAYSGLPQLLRALGGLCRLPEWRGGLLPGPGWEGRGGWITTSSEGLSGAASSPPPAPPPASWPPGSQR
jgi:predicted alpha/beta-fold hydrolase